MKKLKSKVINNIIQDTNNYICNGRGCQQKSNIIVEEPSGKFGAIKLYLCYDCIKKFRRVMMNFEYRNYSHLNKFCRYVWQNNMIKNTKGIELKCQRDGIWHYTGNSQYYACCPKCKSSISIRKNKVQVDLGSQAQNQPETIERKVF